MRVDGRSKRSQKDVKRTLVDQYKTTGLLEMLDGGYTQGKTLILREYSSGILNDSLPPTSNEFQISPVSHSGPSRGDSPTQLD